MTDIRNNKVNLGTEMDMHEGKCHEDDGGEGWHVCEAKCVPRTRDSQKPGE